MNVADHFINSGDYLNGFFFGTIEIFLPIFPDSFSGILKKFYKEVAGKTIQTGMVIAHQIFGYMLRWNSHFHCIVLDGGFDEDMFYLYSLFRSERRTEYFR